MNISTAFRHIVEDRPTVAFGAVALKPILKTASFVYGFIVRLRLYFYKRKLFKAKSLGRAVISIGNLTWGGTGKTPMVEYVARYLMSHEINPLILARGYGKDESRALVNNLPGAKIGIGKDRVAQARKFFDEKDQIDVILLDDGFQHLKINRDLDVVLINALNPFGNRSLIPRGILREPIQGLQRAHFAVLTGVNLVPRQEVDMLKQEISNINANIEFAEACHEPVCFYRARTGDEVSFEKMKGMRVTVFSGIGTPRSFLLLLNLVGVKTVRSFEFGDHHRFLKRELREIHDVKLLSKSAEVITTEKDYFRCPKMITEVVDPILLKIQLKLVSGEGVFQEKLLRTLTGSNYV